MKNLKYAEKLLQKSQNDLVVLKKLYTDPEVADGILNSEKLKLKNKH